MKLESDNVGFTSVFALLEEGGKGVGFVEDLGRRTGGVRGVGGWKWVRSWGRRWRKKVGRMK